jgi:hypothetical protein
MDETRIHPQIHSNYADRICSIHNQNAMHRSIDHQILEDKEGRVVRKLSLSEIACDFTD